MQPRHARTASSPGIGSVALLVLVALFADGARCQSYPTKPIRLLVGFPPAGGADVVARGLGRKLAESLGQSVVRRASR